MIRNFLAVLVAGLGLFGCSRQNNSSVFEARYVGHLKLDSTILLVSEVADSINLPWDIYAREREIWFTQIDGKVNILNLVTGVKREIFNIPDVYHKKSFGLLGMTLHPDFETIPWVFMHYTFLINGQDNEEIIKSRIVRYTYVADSLTERTILLDSIPGKTFHNGSRLEISPDMKLFFSMGDAGEGSRFTQSKSSCVGKILRLNLDGSIPLDNPDPASYVWSMGHRNPQGLTFGKNGQLYSSEHGPLNDDEVNLIVAGGNYGWPDVHGYCDLPNEQAYCLDSAIIEPLMAWTPTLAVAGMDYYSFSQIPEWQNSLLVANMKGRALRVLSLNDIGDAITEERIYFQKIVGRIRDVSVSPDGAIYFSTSNTDWHPRYQPFMYDSLPVGGDRIYRLIVVKDMEPINGQKVRLFTMDTVPLSLQDENWSFDVDTSSLSVGGKLYIQYCAGCHQPDGLGTTGLIPPLSKTDWVIGDKGRLIRTLLFGMSGKLVVNGQSYEQEMPPFSNLTDEELANVLTYIRNNFSNEANAVIAGEVLEERKTKRN